MSADTLQKRFRNFRISHPLSDEASLAWFDMTGLLLILEFSFQITSHNIILDTAHQKEKSEVLSESANFVTILAFEYVLTPILSFYHFIYSNTSF